MQWLHIHSVSFTGIPNSYCDHQLLDGGNADTLKRAPVASSSSRRPLQSTVCRSWVPCASVLRSAGPVPARVSHSSSPRSSPTLASSAPELGFHTTSSTVARCPCAAQQRSLHPFILPTQHLSSSPNAPVQRNRRSCPISSAQAMFLSSPVALLGATHAARTHAPALSMLCQLCSQVNKNRQVPCKLSPPRNRACMPAFP